MRRRLLVLTIMIAVAGLAGCSRDKDDRPAPQAQPPIPSMSTGALPSVVAPAPGATSNGPSGGPPTQVGATDPAGAALGHPQTLPTGTEINATGIGPYTVGQEQAALTTAKLVGAVKTGANGCDTGAGSAKWGSPTLLFTKGKLQHIKITNPSVKTTAGVRVGDSEASLHAAYPDGRATGAAWYAPTGDFALLFRVGGGKVTAIESGPASILETGATGC
jgi:hypothetical protein